jgi:hypothetical protein
VRKERARDDDERIEKGNDYGRGEQDSRERRGDETGAVAALGTEGTETGKNLSLQAHGFSPQLQYLPHDCASPT